MSPVSNKLKETLVKKCPITFRDFMELALYDPEAGYYSKHGVPIGSKGDFVTSPHVGEIFGALLTVQLEQMWRILGKETFQLIEIGAGAGYLAKDLLEFASRMEFGNAIEYTIVEPFASNRQFQRITLGALSERVTWIDNLSSLSGITGCILSNELLDAFPVHLVQMTDSGFKEVYVNCVDGNSFYETLGEISSEQLQEYLNSLDIEFDTGYKTEVNLEMKRWIHQVSRVLRQGFVFTIDYGHTKREYFHPGRNRGTLLSYRGHHVIDNVLSNPGDQDITAHVNFSDLHIWGKQAGFITLGYSTQWAFLGSIGVEKVLSQLYGSGEAYDPFSPRNMALKMLLLPQGMGDSHKVLIQAKGVDEDKELIGFRLRNLVSRLEL